MAEVMKISASEFTAWKLQYERDPWGELRADYRAAIMPTLYASAHTPKGRRPPELREFVLDFGRQREAVESSPAAGRLSPEQSVDYVAALTVALGGKDLRRSPAHG